VLILDSSEQTILERLRRCRVVVAACESSIFVRECEDCDFVLYTKQLRTRDCRRLRLALFSQTRPVIETSSDLLIGCARLSWFSHTAALDAARLNPLSSRWLEVHDFNRGAAAGGRHWERMPLPVERTGLLALPIPSAAKGGADDGQPPAVPGDALGDEGCVRVAWDGEPASAPAWAVPAGESTSPPTAGRAPDGTSPTSRLLVLAATAGDDHQGPGRALLGACRTAGPADGCGDGLPTAPVGEAGDGPATIAGAVVARTRMLIAPRAAVAALPGGGGGASMAGFLRAVPAWPAVVTVVQLTGPRGFDAAEALAAAGCAVASGEAAPEAAWGRGGLCAGWCSEDGEAGEEAVRRAFLDWDAAENKG